MKIFLATGYSVINLKDREKQIYKMFGGRLRRLFSFADHQCRHARITRSLEVYTGHVSSEREESEL